MAVENDTELLVCGRDRSVSVRGGMIPLRVLLGFFAIHQMAGAVVVISGAANNTAPPGQPYFSNVTMLGGGSAIYLGNRWVLSAAHVSGSLPGSVSFGGMPYSTVPGSFNRLYDPSTYPGPMPVFTDLVLFRLTSDPGLPWLEIAAGSPTVSTPVMMIGGGRVQEATPKYWDVVINPGPANDTWTELGFPYTGADAAGFRTTAAREVRWGENQIAGTGTTINYGAGPVTMFHTIFNSGAATHEAQGVIGDSGGAVFTPNGGDWRLAGVMLTVGNFENQPGGAETAVLGNATYAADLSLYRSQIIDITAIPEPTGHALATLGFLMAATRRSRPRQLACPNEFDLRRSTSR